MVGRSLLGAIGVILTQLLLLTSVAQGEPSCTLTATPPVVHINQPLMLTLTPSTSIDAAFINQTRVGVPVGTLSVTQTMPGNYDALGMILIDRMEYFCSTTYEVLPGEQPATLVGDVVSAATGLALPGVAISMQPSGMSTTSDAAGAFTLANVPFGAYSLTATLAGYTTETYSGTATPGPNPPIHFVLNPVLPDGQLRVVLTWGESPRDLDSHLFTRWAAGDVFHLSYRALRGLNGTLDVDDTSSFGPETVTILDETPGRYSYAINDYTNKAGPGQIISSGAIVKVYQGNNLIEEFRPTNRGTEVSWYVFDADISPNGTLTITPVNTYSNVDLDTVTTLP